MRFFVYEVERTEKASQAESGAGSASEETTIRLRLMDGAFKGERIHMTRRDRLGDPGDWPSSAPIPEVGQIVGEDGQPTLAGLSAVDLQIAGFLRLIADGVVRPEQARKEAAELLDRLGEKMPKPAEPEPAADIHPGCI